MMAVPCTGTGLAGCPALSNVAVLIPTPLISVDAAILLPKALLVLSFCSLM